MDIDSYGYVVLVAGLGMAIVFLFLWFLSGLMSLIQVMFGGRERNLGDPESALAVHKPTTRSARQERVWVIAAAAAFLEAERTDKKSVPGPWVSGRANHADPWLSATPTRMP